MIRYRRRESWDYLNGEKVPGSLKVLVLCILSWVVLLLVDMLLCLLERNWFGVAVDVLCAIYLWWVFFDGGGKWKKWRKRAKEKVAVIKGRLKVVAVPSPAPA